jgi:hypothetical protein
MQYIRLAYSAYTSSSCLFMLLIVANITDRSSEGKTYIPTLATNAIGEDLAL